MTRHRPRLALVGAGRVGRALGFVLRNAGYAIGSVVCRKPSSARDAVMFIGGGTARTISRLRAVDGDLVIVASPDDAIEDVARRIALLPERFEGRTILHVSGSLSSTVLGELKRRGAWTGSCHPLQSFPTAELGATRIAGSTFAIEGDRAAVALAMRLARDAGGRPMKLRAADKPLYHAAAVMASGHVAALLDASLEALQAVGMSEEDAREALMPLVEGTVANIRRTGTRVALTGPFARGDEATIERNRAALMAVSEALARVYEELGVRSRVMARR